MKHKRLVEALLAIRAGHVSVRTGDNGSPEFFRTDAGRVDQKFLNELARPRLRDEAEEHRGLGEYAPTSVPGQTIVMTLSPSGEEKLISLGR